MPNSIRLLALLIFSALNAPTVFAQDADPILRQAEELIAQSKPDEAFKLLSPLEAQKKGDTRFDYLLGASLLEMGKPEAAIPLFKRVLAANPLFAAARLDLGRAYYVSGNYSDAKSAFQTVLGQNPPASAQQAIEYYLAEIDQRDRNSFSGTAFVSAALGRDNNVSGGIESGRLFVVGFVDPFLLDPKSIKAPDTYLTYSAGGNLRWATQYQFVTFVSADIARRDNYQLHDFDSVNGTLQAGVDKTVGASNFKLSANFGRGVLDGADLRRNAGGALEWRYDFDRLNQMTWYVQSGRVRYAPLAYQSYDIDQRQAGASWFVVSEAKGNPSLSLSAYIGNEKALRDLPDGNKRTVGARVNSQIGIWGGAVLGAGAGFSRDTFDLEREILFDIKPDAQPVTLTRQDQRIDANLGLVWSPSLNWTIRPSLTYSRATSNIPIYAFTRNDFALAIRREFK
jgi:outer membrane protein